MELQVNHDDSGNLLSRTVEFTWIDWTKREHQVWREEFNLIASSKMSCFSGRSLKTKVERVVSKREKEMRTRYPPPKNLLILRTAQLVLVPHLHQNRYPGMTRLARFEASEDGKAWLKRQEFLKPFLNEALDTLWWNPEEDQKAATADLSKRTAEERAAMETIADWVDTSQQSVYDIAEKDLIAGTNEDVLPRTSRDVIYLGVDKNQKVVLFRWRGAMEVLLGKAILTKFPQDRDTFAKYQPCPAGDFARHPLNAEWLRRNEQFDMMKTPGACQGVWHFGVGEEIGKGPKSVRLKTDSVLGIEKMKSEDGSNGRKADPDLVRIRDQMMMEGVFPPVTRATMFVHGILDPVQLKKQQAAMQQLKQIGGVMTVPDEAYSIRGVLKDVKTESHRDTGDVVPDLALLCVFGDAKGKIPLIDHLAGPDVNYTQAVTSVLQNWGQDCHSKRATYLLSRGERRGILRIGGTAPVDTRSSTHSARWL